MDQENTKIQIISQTENIQENRITNFRKTNIDYSTYDFNSIMHYGLWDFTVNGEQTFREASWEEALDIIAEKFKSIKEKYGSEAFALLKHGSPGKHLEHLFKAYGSDTIAEPAYAQCRGAREAGFALTYGSWVGSPEPTDIRDTKCLVLIGSHIGENMHNSQVQEMSDAIDNGATIITVDPRFSTAASKSKHWLAIKPATDIALMLAWMNVIIEEGLYDKNYVEKYTT